MNKLRKQLFLIRAVLGSLGIAASALTCPSAYGQTYSIVESFSGADGAYPMGGLILGGSTLYGMTSAGGTDNDGTIFSISPDSGFQTICSFSGGTGGNQPHHGSLAVSDGTLYGMTLYGGASSNGNIFSVGTDGSGYQNLYSFSGGSADGSQPHGDLVVSGSTLYGMTSGASGPITSSTNSSAAGSTSNGNIFSIGTDGTGFQSLVSFSGTTGANLGEQPHTGLMVNGSTLYGMTLIGGTNGEGNIFSVGTNGASYQNLLSFNGLNGAAPAGNLLLSGSTLYGMTSMGGIDNDGTIFSINTDGTGFHSLLSFTGTNGAIPWGVLALSGTTLYGMTAMGGISGDGTVFSIGTDGSNFQDMVSFDGTNGATPWGSVILDGSTLYGMTMYGGVNNKGVLFSLTTQTVPEPGTFAILGIGAGGLLGHGWRRRRMVRQ